MGGVKAPGLTDMCAFGHKQAGFQVKLPGQVSLQVWRWDLPKSGWESSSHLHSWFWSWSQMDKIEKGTQVPQSKA